MKKGYFMKKFIFILVVVSLFSCRKMPEGNMKEKLARYRPIEIKWDGSNLLPWEKQVLKEISKVEALIDELFLIQVHKKNKEWLNSIEDPDTREYFLINFGPWDRLDENKPFWGISKKPKGASFYPEDMTKEEFENYVKGLSEEEQKNFRSYFTVIVREGRNLKAIPYSIYYQNYLKKLSDILNNAADISESQSLKKFLKSRAESFLSNDYYQSDMDWMDVSDTNLEITIGPYETYEDELLGLKASFEAFVGIINKEETEKLKFVEEHLKELDQNLPYPKDFKGVPKGLSSPIKVVDLIFSAGDTKAGIQTIAFNLPNDERVVAQKGSKKVMLKNVIEAKYEGILVPISEQLLEPEIQGFVSKDAFFNETLFHEVSHGLGPGIIYLSDGKETTVRDSLKDLYSFLEEAKADVSSLYLIEYLLENKKLPGRFKEESPATYLASMFRSLRFGINEAHGKGVLLQFNWLYEKGAILRSNEGKYILNLEKFKEGIKTLLERIIYLQATGDYEGVKELSLKYTNPPEFLIKDLERLKQIPVDIRPIYNSAIGSFKFRKVWGSGVEA